jgi:E3 ubiquitin-protein ligase BRE1
LIDEVKILVGDSDEKGKGSVIPALFWPYNTQFILTRSPDEQTFRTSLLFDDNENFEKHLKVRSEEIKDTLSRLLAHTPKAPPEVSELQSQLAKKLAEEKLSIAELEKALSDKQQLEEQLEAASLRYMVAEKKLDRARSLTVAKLEKQYLLGAQRPGGDSAASANREESAPVNGVSPSREKDSDLEEAYHKTLAVSQKQKEQLDALEAENAKLTSQITDLNLKVNPKLSNLILRGTALLTDGICRPRSLRTMITPIPISSSN